MHQVARGAAVLLVLLAFTGSAHARDHYGAIAYSPSTGATGYSYDHYTRADAEAGALNECGKRASDCQLPLWFRNACGALAVGSGGSWGTGWGTSRGLAERHALATCRKLTSGCSVASWVCTTR